MLYVFTYKLKIYKTEFYFLIISEKINNISLNVMNFFHILNKKPLLVYFLYFVEKIAYLRLILFLVFDILIGESITSNIFLHRRVIWRYEYLNKNKIDKIGKIISIEKTKWYKF